MEEKIQKQVTEHNHLNKSINNLLNTLRFQRRIQSAHTIPKKFKPITELKITQPNDNSLQEAFHANFRNIFFQHLDKVILSNEIALEIKKARLESIIQSTESILADYEGPPKDIRSLYNLFTSKTNLTNRDPCPKLRKLLTETSYMEITGHASKSTNQTPTTSIKVAITDNPTIPSHQETAAAPVSVTKPIPINQYKPQSTKKNLGKRKHTEIHPDGKKQLKILSFLGRSNPSSHRPT